MASRYMGFLYLFFVSIIGLIFGTVYVQMLPHAQMSDIVEQWGAVFIYTADVKPTFDTFLTFFLYQLRLFIFMFVFGITIIGFPIALLIHFLKTFLIGSTIQLFIFLWGDQSLLYIAIWLLPSSLFLIVGLIIMTSSLARYSYGWIHLFKRQSQSEQFSFVKLAKQSILTLICLLLASVTHAYLSPYLFNYFLEAK